MPRFNERSLAFTRRLRVARVLSLLLTGVLAIAMACGGVVGSAPSGADAGPQVVAQNVGPGGGIISLGGLTLTIPPGALSSQETITITRTLDPVPPGYVGFSPVYKFAPGGLTFAIPAILSMPFSGDPTRATLFWSRPDAGGYDRVAAQVVNGAAVGDVTHFSTGFVGIGLQTDAAEGASDATTEGAATDATTDAVATDTTVTDAPMDVDVGDATFDAGDGAIDADDASETASDAGAADGGLTDDASIDAVQDGLATEAGDDASDGSVLDGGMCVTCPGGQQDCCTQGICCKWFEQICECPTDSGISMACGVMSPCVFYGPTCFPMPLCGAD